MRPFLPFLCVLLFGMSCVFLVGAAPYPGGDIPPGGPRLFAPGLVNTGLLTRDVAMTPDGQELYFCQATVGYRQAAILVMTFGPEGWSEPEVASFSGRAGWVDLEPCVSPDGNHLYFYSSRPAVPGGEAAQDLWVVDREDAGWSEPRNLGMPVNTEAPEFFPSITADGTLYFCRADPRTRLHQVYRARPVPGGFAEPELLPAQVNSGRSQFNAWVAPDESRMIIPVAGHPDNLGGVDYWLATRNAQDVWSGPFNLGPQVNDGSPGSWSPYVSPDGQALFFMSGRTEGPGAPWPSSWLDLQNRHFSPGSGRAGIYWMQAAFLDQLPESEPGLAEKEVGDPSLTAGPGAVREHVDWVHCSGPYLGQDPPGEEPVIFAPGQISTGMNERDIVISPDGRTIYYGVMDLGLVTVLMTRDLGDRWSVPVSAPFHAEQDFACFEPTLGHGGHEVFFLSNQAAPGQTQGRGWANQNIFHSRFADGRWSPPEALPAPVTTDAAEYFPSAATDGTLYFSREDSLGHPFLWSAEPTGQGGFEAPVRLPDTVNVGTSCYNAFVAPDESFLIACVAGHAENLGAADYWISSRDPQGQWQPARNLGPRFNGPDTRAASAFLSPDGQYLFFSSSRSAVAWPDRFNRADLHRFHGQPGNGASD
nr:hypothetical protein [Candidatus Krumholzibacteria bacterium]